MCHNIGYSSVINTVFSLFIELLVALKKYKSSDFSICTYTCSECAILFVEDSHNQS